MASTSGATPDPRDQSAGPGASGRARMLDALNICAEAEELYLNILDKDGLNQDEHARHSSLVGELLEAGLVRIEDERLMPVSIRLAIDSWIFAQQDRITQARRAVEHLITRQRSTQGNFIEVVSGRPRCREAAKQLEVTARHRLRAFEREPYFHDTQNSPHQAASANRGVEYQVVYQQEALHDPRLFENLRASIAVGERARMFARLPLRMLIADDHRAMVTLPYGTDSSQSEPADLDALIVHPSAFLDGLTRLFEVVWDLSLPIGDIERSEESQHLLHLLATGLTDAAIARHLGISQRTLHRRIRTLQVSLGAESRFLLGVHAVRRGLI